MRYCTRSNRPQLQWQWSSVSHTLNSLWPQTHVVLLSPAYRCLTQQFRPAVLRSVTTAHPQAVCSLWVRPQSTTRFVVQLALRKYYEQQRCHNGWMNGWMDGWMDGWMNGWKSKWRNKWINERSVRRIRMYILCMYYIFIPPQVRMSVCCEWCVVR
jgi:hypothetical protein